MPTQAHIDTHARFIERDTERKIRHRNKLYYRFNHWPIWIFVFFIAPGPLTFDLFERGFDARLLTWLSVVLIGTGIAGLFGKLPGCEPAPYIIRFTEDRPDLLYDRVGRSHRIRGTQRRWFVVRDRHRRMATEADVRVVLLSHRRNVLGA